MNYRVSEIYRAVQGEGWHSGLPCTLVRLQGCNLRCDFCDTPYAQDPEGGCAMTEEEIYTQVERLHRKRDIVLITGGEPTLQILRPLILKLSFLGPIHLETNGTSEVTLSPLSTIIDWITVSPKPPAKCTAGSFFHADEIKWLIGDSQDIVALKEFLQLRHVSFKSPKKICVQPIFRSPPGISLAVDSLATAIAYQACLDNGWRLSLQIHKMIGEK